MLTMSSNRQIWQQGSVCSKEALDNLVIELNDRKPSAGQVLTMCSLRGMRCAFIGVITDASMAQQSEVLSINYWVKIRTGYWAWFTGADRWRLHVRFQPPDTFASAELVPALFGL